MPIFRLVFVYLLAGIGILYVQLSSTPCQRALVLDDGRGAVAPPIDLTRLGIDPAYQWDIGRDVVFWLPRMLHFVVLGDVSMQNFLHATDCVAVKPAAAAAG